MVLALLTGCTRPHSSNDSSDSEYPSVENTSSENTSSEISSSEESGVSLEFYAFNDFHGAVTANSAEPGIFSFGSYLREKHTNNPNNNSVLLNVGDYWQGSADSNINRGAFLTEVGNLLEFDAMTLGNHEFDWYDTHIISNKALAEFPFLGANIRHANNDEVATNLVSYDDTFKGSVMVSRNGVNIGIVGTMGSKLETSILAPAVAPYYFADVDAVIRDEIANLEELGANMIVLATHDSLTDEYVLSEYQSIIDEGLVDIIFSAHYHRYNNSEINGIPIMETNGYGKGVMEVAGNYDFVTDTFTITKHEVSSTSTIQNYPEDQEIKDLFTTTYEPEIEAVKNEVLTTLSSSMSYDDILNVAIQSMYDHGVSLEYENVVAVHNSSVGVNSFKAGVLTYGDVYRAFRYDNEVRIIPNVNAADAKYFIGNYNVSYPNRSDITSDKMYTIVTIDYLSTAPGRGLSTRPQELTGLLVRDLVADYFRNY